MNWSYSQAQDGPTTGRQGPGPPQRRASNLQVAAHTVAGDLHTSEHTKKDTREVSQLLQAACTVSVLR